MTTPTPNQARISLIQARIKDIPNSTTLKTLRAYTKRSTIRNILLLIPGLMVIMYGISKLNILFVLVGVFIVWVIRDEFKEDKEVEKNEHNREHKGQHEENRV